MCSAEYERKLPCAGARGQEGALRLNPEVHSPERGEKQGAGQWLRFKVKGAALEPGTDGNREGVRPGKYFREDHNPTPALMWWGKESHGETVPCFLLFWRLYSLRVRFWGTQKKAFTMAVLKPVCLTHITSLRIDRLWVGSEGPVMAVRIRVVPLISHKAGWRGRIWQDCHLIPTLAMWHVCACNQATNRIEDFIIKFGFLFCQSFCVCACVYVHTCGRACVLPCHPQAHVPGVHSCLRSSSPLSCVPPCLLYLCRIYDISLQTS